MDPLLEIALRAAVAGGEAVMRVYADPFEVSHKDDKTPVTEADLASERVIVEILSRACPDIPVVSEETVPEAGFASPAARFWCVDPLDGTREFVARNGEFAVLVGLIEDGRPVLGVVHGPVARVTYTGYGPGTAPSGASMAPTSPRSRRAHRGRTASSSCTAAATRTVAGWPSISRAAGSSSASNAAAR
jgi:3'(2'),5'-bisphosphate nucleotidase